MHGGLGNITAWSSAATLRKAFGNVRWVAALLKQVDFKTEQLVLVSWTTSGPPEGELRFRATTIRGQEVITFYVDPPKGVRVRGNRARLGADFFAIPRDAMLRFTPEP